MKELTQQRLKELLYYNPRVGVFEWRKGTRKVKPGQIAGSVSGITGYVELGIDRRKYRVHHLVWFYVKGSWPAQSIDHIDGDKTNNLISNLREVTGSENCWNAAMPITNTSGIKGVSFNVRTGLWVGSLRVSGGQIRKAFKSRSEAAEWVRSAREVAHGKFANHGVHKYQMEDVDGE